MSKLKKPRKIEPNWTHWYEPNLVRDGKTTHESYHKEYMSYVEAFNKAIEEFHTPAPVAESITLTSVAPTTEVKGE